MCQHFQVRPLALWHRLSARWGGREREGGHPVDPTTTYSPHVIEGIGHVFPGIPAPCFCVTLHNLGQHGLLQWTAPPTHWKLPYVLLPPSASTLVAWDWKERNCIPLASCPLFHPLYWVGAAPGTWCTWQWQREWFQGLAWLYQ